MASSRSPAKTPDTAAEIEHLGGSRVCLDVTSPQPEDQAKSALAAYGRIDVLVNNAGVGMGGAAPS